MKHWFWRRFVIVLLAIVLPISAVSASPVPSSYCSHGAMHGIDDTVTLTSAGDTTCLAGSEIDQPVACANMDQSCASCMAAVPPAVATTIPLATSALLHFLLVNSSSFVPPLLERPPALNDFIV